MDFDLIDLVFVDHSTARVQFHNRRDPLSQSPDVRIAVSVPIKPDDAIRDVELNARAALAGTLRAAVQI